MGKFGKEDWPEARMLCHIPHPITKRDQNDVSWVLALSQFTKSLSIFEVGRKESASVASFQYSRFPLFFLSSIRDINVKRFVQGL